MAPDIAIYRSGKKGWQPNCTGVSSLPSQRCSFWSLISQAPPRQRQAVIADL